MSNYETFCKDLKDSFQGVLSWKWDSRFNAILTEFSQEIKDQIRKVLDRHLNYIWDSTILAKSPDSVQAIGNKLGGLMSTQLLFTSDPDQPPISFCAWWPWGDGQTISIRVSFADPTLDADQSADLEDQVKSWFDL